MKDPAIYIYAAALFGAALGFITAALFASRTIRESREEAFQDGYATANRDQQNHGKL